MKKTLFILATIFCLHANAYTTPTINSSTICAGNTVFLNVDTNNTSITHCSWSTGQSGNFLCNISVSPTVTTVYSVTVIYAGGTQTVTLTSTVTVFAYPVVTVNSATICGGGSTSANLTANGASAYTWAPATGLSTTTGASVVANPTVTTTYTITGANSICTNTAISVVYISANPAPAICEVSTDSTSNYNYNIVYWANTYPNVDSFIVYRYSPIAASYLRIGAVSKDSLSEFKDTSFSVGGPNGGNPQVGSWQYTLAIRDTCGNISPQSPYHQSMFIQNTGSNFSWNLYTIGTGQTNPVTGYSFFRDNNNTGNWQVVANLGNTATATTDPAYSSYPNGNWRIDALGFTCNPAYRLAGGGNNNTYATRVKSHSNTNRQAAAGIKQIKNSNSQVNIYPNPSNGMFNVKLSNYDNASIEVYNLIGEKIHTEIVQNNTTQLDLSSYANGMYQLRVLKNNAPVYQTKISKID